MRKDTMALIDEAEECIQFGNMAGARNALELAKRVLTEERGRRSLLWGAGEACYGEVFVFAPPEYVVLGAGALVTGAKEATILVNKEAARGFRVAHFAGAQPEDDEGCIYYFCMVKE